MLTVLPAPASAAGDGLSVQCRTSATGASADQVEPWFKATNTGTSSVQLSDVKVRYYFNADSASATYRFACSWAAKGCSNVTGTFGTLANPTATADRYLEIGFAPGAGSLAPGADTGDLQLRFNQSTWASVNQSDDYSFGASQTSYGDWSKVTAQLAGTIVWGQDPAGNGLTDRPTDLPTAPLADGATLFDDFNYSSHSDPKISANGWSVRSNSGGPACPASPGRPRTSPSPPPAAIRS